MKLARSVIIFSAVAVATRLSGCVSTGTAEKQVGDDCHARCTPKTSKA